LYNFLQRFVLLDDLTDASECKKKHV
jgi:hypothetical protein